MNLKIANFFLWQGLGALTLLSPLCAQTWQCPCPGMSRDSGMPSSGPAPDCNTVCFGAGGGASAAPNYNQYYQNQYYQRQLQQQQLEIRKQQVLQQQQQAADAANAQAVVAQQAERNRENQDAAARAAQIKAAQDAHFQQARDNAAANLKGAGDSDSGVKPSPGPKTKPAGYAKGFADASGCFSRNAGRYCAGADATGQHACLTAYGAGFDLGEIKRKAAMQEAYAAGRQAGGSGKLADGASDARAQGSCRVEWIENYNRGFFQSMPKNPAR
ncbi:MAG: hypothetical protein ACYCPQ_06635 [Elusimicrobiota bacterium]